MDVNRSGDSPNADRSRETAGSGADDAPSAATTQRDAAPVQAASQHDQGLFLGPAWFAAANETGQLDVDADNVDNTASEVADAYDVSVEAGQLAARAAFDRVLTDGFPFLLASPDVDDRTAAYGFASALLERGLAMGGEEAVQSAVTLQPVVEMTLSDASPALVRNALTDASRIVSLYQRYLTQEVIRLDPSLLVPPRIDNPRIWSEELSTEVRKAILRQLTLGDGDDVVQMLAHLRSLACVSLDDELDYFMTPLADDRTSSVKIRTITFLCMETRGRLVPTETAVARVKTALVSLDASHLEGMMDVLTGSYETRRDPLWLAVVATEYLERIKSGTLKGRHKQFAGSLVESSKVSRTWLRKS